MEGVKTMLIKNNLKQNIINIMVSLACVLLLFGGNFILSTLGDIENNIKEDIEIEWRYQAKRTLSSIHNKIIYDIDHDEVNPLDCKDLERWAKSTVSGISNGGENGTIFIVNLSNEKFIWDSSDVVDNKLLNSDKGRFLSDEILLHDDTDTTIDIIENMRKGASTILTNDRYSWTTNGKVEYLEWAVVPSGQLGFNEEPKTVEGIKNTKYDKILVVLRTQKHEVESNFTNVFRLINSLELVTQVFVILSVCMSMLNMLIYVFLNKKKRA